VPLSFFSSSSFFPVPRTAAACTGEGPQGDGRDHRVSAHLCLVVELAHRRGRGARDVVRRLGLRLGFPHPWVHHRAANCAQALLHGAALVLEVLLLVLVDARLLFPAIKEENTSQHGQETVLSSHGYSDGSVDRLVAMPSIPLTGKHAGTKIDRPHSAPTTTTNTHTHTHTTRGGRAPRTGHARGTGRCRWPGPCFLCAR
jgi:hypothetical protein